MTHTDWKTTAGLDKKRGKEVWTHTAPHYVNDGERDGEVSFSDDVLEQFVDDGGEDESESETGDAER